MSGQKHNFETNLIKTINEDKNTILSSLSILSALSLAMKGAKNNTLKEMNNVLFNGENKDMMELCNYYNNLPIISIANCLWIRRNFAILDSYIKKCGVNLDEIPDTADIVNQWCSDNTNGMITEVVTDELVQNPDLMLMITNAIHFKAKFAQQFDKDFTRENTLFYSDFDPNRDSWSNQSHINRNQIGKVSMMFSDCERFCVMTNKFDVVSLPYKDSSISLVLVKNNKRGVDLNDFNINSVNFRYKSEINLYVPKFKIEYEIELSSVLQKMGIRDAFDSRRADFSDITDEIGLYIGGVIHKAVIEVDEEGTEAAAVTVVSMCFESACMPTVVKFDHPFKFYIYDNDKKIVLFSGIFTGK